MKMQYYKPIFSFILFFLSIQSYSQHYPFTTITLKDGLPQACIFKVIQDKQGYMWMGTEAGICRYDGNEFVNYSYESGLLSNYIKDIEIDSRGRLWVGLFDCGAAVFDGSGFYTFDLGKTVGFNYLVDLHFSSNGDLWIADRDSGIVRIQMTQTPKVTVYKHNGLSKSGYKVLSLKNGDVLGLTANGITRFKKEDNYRGIDMNLGVCMSAYEDESGGLWIGGIDLLYYIKDDSIYNKSQLISAGQQIYDMLKPFANEGIYMATNMGLLIIGNKNKRLLTTHNGLSYDLLRSMCKDRFGNVWVTTYGNGATLVNKNTIVHYDTDGKGNDFCSFTMIEDASGDMILGRYMDGYYICNDSTFKKFDLGIPPNANPYNSVKDADQNIYLLTHNNNIYKVKNKKTIAKYHLNIPSTTYSILLMDSSRILLCTDAGAYILDEKTQKTEEVTNIPTAYFSTAFRDEDGFIWMAGDRGEILRYKDKSVVNYTSLLNPTRSGINQGLYDKKHHLYWFATDAGLVIWNGYKIFKLTTNNGVNSNVFYSITIDHLDRIWAGHIKGLECIDLEKKQIIHIGYNEGFLPMETNVNAAMTDSKGNVWFGTVSSVSKIDMAHFGRDSTTGILRLQQISINNKIVFKENYNDSVYPQLKLKHDENNLSFKVTSICFTNSKTVKYQWILEGEDKQWNEKADYREISYNNLSPGTYTFRVKALNPNGYVTNEIKIPISISKPFWNTFGFYLLEIALFGAIVVLSFFFTSINSENRFGQIMTLVAVLIVFEAILLMISSYTDKYTHGIPVFQLVMNVVFAATLHPLESGIRRIMKKIVSRKGRI